MTTPHSSAPGMPSTTKAMPPSAPWIAATTTLPLTVERTTEVKLRYSRCCTIGSSGTARWMRRISLSPSSSRKNSRYSITRKLTEKSSVFWLMVQSWRVIGWEPSAADCRSFSCTAGRSFMPAFSSTLEAQPGSAPISRR